MRPGRLYGNLLTWKLKKALIGLFDYINSAFKHDTGESVFVSYN